MSDIEASFNKNMPSSFLKRLTYIEFFYLTTAALKK